MTDSLLKQYRDLLLKSHEPVKDESEWICYNENLEEIESKIDTKLAQLDYITNVFIDAEIPPPYDLWLSHAKELEQQLEQKDRILDEIKGMNVLHKNGYDIGIELKSILQKGEKK